MAMPGKRSGKRSSMRARVQCAHLQNSRSFSALKLKRDPSAAMIESEARSALTSQACDSAAIGGVIDISKSFAADVTLRPATCLATNCRHAPQPGFGNYLLVRH